MEKINYGKVYFVGAGPGDPELLTVKAVRILAEADAVIADRLVGEEIIKRYVNASAIVVPVGKQGRSNASTPQPEINNIIIQFAAAYKKVIRLKGGDVSLYSNILDELIIVKNHQIEYEIIPGITALSGASAYTGVPLTARGFATGVRVLTYYTNTAISDEAWKHLALFENTLVFYMTGNALPQLVNNLLKAGADETIPFLMIEQATTPNQYVQEFTLGGFTSVPVHQEFVTPSLVVMGKVASLYKQFAWLPNNNERIPYFKPLQDYPELISLINTIQQSSHVSRA